MVRVLGAANWGLAAALGTMTWLTVSPAPAQANWPSWADEAFSGPTQGGNFKRRVQQPNRSDEQQREEKRTDEKRKRPGPALLEGGPRPSISPQAPPVVNFSYAYPARSIVIDTSQRKLYYVLGGGRAYAYPISVGRDGFNWTGTEKITNKRSWPDWHPPKEMRERDPSLPVKMTGGVRNPLGAMALYLGNTLYRIHGTNDARSIGRAASSGCFRMMNANVMHLASLADIGTTVTVVSGLRGGSRIGMAGPQR